jgi:hypothetical protein
MRSSGPMSRLGYVNGTDIIADADAAQPRRPGDGVFAVRVEPGHRVRGWGGHVGRHEAERRSRRVLQYAIRGEGPVALGRLVWHEAMTAIAVATQWPHFLSRPARRLGGSNSGVES